jgi:hypothetical protein
LADENFGEEILSSIDYYTREGDTYEYDDKITRAGRHHEEAEYEALHGVRRPDPVKQQRLVGGGIGYADNPLGRAEDPSVSWLFDPPRHISFPGPFDDVSYYRIFSRIDENDPRDSFVYSIYLSGKKHGETREEMVVS